MNRPQDDFWNDNLTKNKVAHRKYWYIFGFIFLVIVSTASAYAYDKMQKTTIKSATPKIKTIEPISEEPTKTQCPTPELNGSNIVGLINQYRADNKKSKLAQAENLDSYVQLEAEELSTTKQPPEDLKNTKTGDFWQWQNKNIKSNAKINVSEYSSYALNNKNNNNACDIVEALKSSTTTKDELLSDKYDLLGVGIKDSFILNIFAKTGKSVSQTTPSNQNIVPAPLNPAPVDDSPKKSQHILTFDYFNYRCYDSINGDRDYEIVRAVTEGMGSIWEIRDNRDFLCSNSNSEYYIKSVNRSSVYGSLYGSKSIYFKPFFEYPPEYADDSDGDQISIQYDMNKTKIESITYFGY